MITDETQGPSAITKNPVVSPAADATYLERMETTLEVAEQSVAAAEAIDQAPASAEKKQTA